MSEKKQLKLWLPGEKVDKVEDVAEDWGYKNANAVIEELIDSYLDFLIAAEQKRRDEIERQKETLFGVRPLKKRAG